MLKLNNLIALFKNHDIKSSLLYSYYAHLYQIFLTGMFIQAKTGLSEAVFKLLIDFSLVQCFQNNFNLIYFYNLLKNFCRV